MNKQLFYTYILPLLIGFIGSWVMGSKSNRTFWGDAKWVSIAPIINWFPACMVILSILGIYKEGNNDE